MSETLPYAGTVTGTRKEGEAATEAFVGGQWRKRHGHFPCPIQWGGSPTRQVARVTRTREVSGNVAYDVTVGVCVTP